MRNHLLILPVLFVALSGPALAGPREDVQAGIARCGAIAQDRIYLDCLYGAAQPLRAALGLPPAPVAQTRLVPVSAAPVLGVVAPAASVPAAPQSAAMAPPPAPAPEGNFISDLFDNPKFGLHITTFSFDQRGLFTVWLNDKRVLRQADDDSNRAHWKRAPRETVRLIALSPGKDILEVGGEPGGYVVQPVR